MNKGDVTPVFKWVRSEYEDEIKKAFEKTIAVRKLNKEARELADMYFFETLVRLHRAGEGEPYTGIKSEKPAPIILEADRALDSGSIDNIIKHITTMVSEGIKERFIHAIEAKKHADESVEAGRRFVDDYVKYIHYIERLYMYASGFHKKHEGENLKHRHR